MPNLNFCSIETLEATERAAYGQKDMIKIQIYED